MGIPNRIKRKIVRARHEAHFTKLKDRHLGHRAFVIGNGPSLSMTDLDRLQDEITFASNKIYLAYDQTEWRPTYLTVTDEKVAENNRDVLIAQPETKLFGHGVRKHFDGVKHDILFGIPPINEEEAKKWDLCHGVRTGHSVIYWDLQLAYWMGVREVYVIGVDFSFDTSQVKDTGEEAMNNQVITSGGEQNHFHPDYRPKGETWTMPKLDAQRSEFAFALQKFQEVGGTIVNASRKTKLDVWPLVNFDELF